MADADSNNGGELLQVTEHAVVVVEQLTENTATEFVVQPPTENAATEFIVQSTEHVVTEMQLPLVNSVLHPPEHVHAHAAIISTENVPGCYPRGGPPLFPVPEEARPWTVNAFDICSYYILRVVPLSRVLLYISYKLHKSDGGGIKNVYNYIYGIIHFLYLNYIFKL